MNQAEFAKLIGVSRKTVTMFKHHEYLVFCDNGIDEIKTIELLQKVGKRFDSDGKLIKDNTLPRNTSKKNENEKDLLDFDFGPLLRLEQESTNFQDTIIDEAKKAGVDINEIEDIETRIEIMSKYDIEKVKIFWQGKIEELKYKKEAGSLIEIEKVKDEQTLIARNLRNAFLSLPVRVTPLITANHNPVSIKTILDREIENILLVLTKGA